MKIKASIVVMSHLSDAEISIGNVKMRTHIEFAKYIILQLNGNLNQEIDADEMWEKFNSLE